MRRRRASCLECRITVFPRQGKVLFRNEVFFWDLGGGAPRVSYSDVRDPWGLLSRRAGSIVGESPGRGGRGDTVVRRLGSWSPFRGRERTAGRRSEFATELVVGRSHGHRSGHVRACPGAGGDDRPELQRWARASVTVAFEGSWQGFPHRKGAGPGCSPWHDPCSKGGWRCNTEDFR